MHQIIKPTCPSRQLFIKITFAFMKIFDFLFKIAIFGAYLFLSRDSRHALLPQSSVGFDQKIKKFYKSKSDFYEKLSTRASRYNHWMHFKQFHFFKCDFQGERDVVQQNRLQWQNQFGFIVSKTCSNFSGELVTRLFHFK